MAGSAVVAIFFDAARSGLADALKTALSLPVVTLTPRKPPAEPRN